MKHLPLLTRILAALSLAALCSPDSLWADSLNSNGATADRGFSAVPAKTTGPFSGNFSHSSGGKAAYTGTILQKGANSGGYGYFLLTPATAGNAGAAYLLPK